MKLDTEDLEAIGAAVVKALKAAGGNVAAGTGKAADKPATTKPAGKAKGPKREDVLTKVRELGAKDGKEAAKAVVAEFGAAFGEVPDDKLGELLAAVEAKLAGEAPAEDDF